MLVQVKYRGGVFIQWFYYKNKGEFAKIKDNEEIKCKNKTYNNCFYGRHIHPEVRELQYPLQYTSYIQTNVDLELL